MVMVSPKEEPASGVDAGSATAVGTSNRRFGSGAPPALGTQTTGGEADLHVLRILPPAGSAASGHTERGAAQASRTSSPSTRRRVLSATISSIAACVVPRTRARSATK